MTTTPAKRSLNLNDALNHMLNGNARETAEKRYLEKEELGLLLWEVAKLENAAARQLIELELFTGQRRYTVITAFKQSFYEDEKFGLVWSIHPGQLKTERWHALPIVGRAKRAFESAKLMADSSAHSWLFPQLKKRLATDEGDGHMSEQSANRILAKLQRPGMPLHSQRRFSPHSFRHSFVTWTSDLGFDEAQIQLVTHDAEGRVSILARVYNGDKKMRAKVEILTAWHDFVLDLMNKYAPADIKLRAEFEGKLAKRKMQLSQGDYDQYILGRYAMLSNKAKPSSGRRPQQLSAEEKAELGVLSAAMNRMIHTYDSPTVLKVVGGRSYVDPEVTGTEAEIRDDAREAEISRYIARYGITDEQYQVNREEIQDRALHPKKYRDDDDDDDTVYDD